MKILIVSPELILTQAIIDYIDKDTEIVVCTEVTKYPLINKRFETLAITDVKKVCPESTIFTPHETRVQKRARERQLKKKK